MFVFYLALCCERKTSFLYAKAVLFHEKVMLRKCLVCVCILFILKCISRSYVVAVDSCVSDSSRSG